MDIARVMDMFEALDEFKSLFHMLDNQSSTYLH